MTTFRGTAGSAQDTCEVLTMSVRSLLVLIETILRREGCDAELLMIATEIIAEHDLKDTDADEAAPTLLH